MDKTEMLKILVEAAELKIENNRDNYELQEKTPELPVQEWHIQEHKKLKKAIETGRTMISLLNVFDSIEDDNVRDAISLYIMEPTYSRIREIMEIASIDGEYYDQLDEIFNYN